MPCLGDHQKLWTIIDRATESTPSFASVRWSWSFVSSFRAAKYTTLDGLYLGLEHEPALALRSSTAVEHDAGTAGDGHARVLAVRKRPDLRGAEGEQRLGRSPLRAEADLDADRHRARHDGASNATAARARRRPAGGALVGGLGGRPEPPMSVNRACGRGDAFGSSCTGAPARATVLLPRPSPTAARSSRRDSRPRRPRSSVARPRIRSS